MHDNEVAFTTLLLIGILITNLILLFHRLIKMTSKQKSSKSGNGNTNGSDSDDENTKHIIRNVTLPTWKPSTRTSPKEFQEWAYYVKAKILQNHPHLAELFNTSKSIKPERDAAFYYLLAGTIDMPTMKQAMAASLKEGEGQTLWEWLNQTFGKNDPGALGKGLN